MGPFIERYNPGLLWIQCSRFRNISNIVYGNLGFSCQNQPPGYEKIEDMATSISKAGLAMKEPHVEIPVRSVSNMKYNVKKRILEMGSNTQRRELFNVGQARKFMQMLLVSKGCKDLIEAEKTLSLRGIYYMSLHTIEGTS